MMYLSWTIGGSTLQEHGCIRVDPYVGQASYPGPASQPASQHAAVPPTQPPAASPDAIALPDPFVRTSFDAELTMGAVLSIISAAVALINIALALGMWAGKKWQRRREKKFDNWLRADAAERMRKADAEARRSADDRPEAETSWAPPGDPPSGPASPASPDEREVMTIEAVDSLLVHQAELVKHGYQARVFAIVEGICYVQYTDFHYKQDEPMYDLRFQGLASAIELLFRDVREVVLVNRTE